MLLKVPVGDTATARQATIAAIAAVSMKYEGNLIATGETVASTRKHTAYRFVLRTQDSHKAPSRLSASGRRTVAASWEAHREVMEAIFANHPEAIIKTAMTTYRGKADFDHRHRDTYNRNVGSAAKPVMFGSL